jgi:Lon protease-like protein
MAPEIVTVPVFPLPEVVFFPGTLLPLHVFEPRYKDMISDVLAGDGMLGVVQLRPGWDKDYYGNPAVYKVLGVGRIVQNKRWPDGRYDILLHGLYRGAIRSESKQGEYRLAEVEPLPDHVQQEHQQELQVVHERLLELYNKLSEALPDTANTLVRDSEAPNAGSLVDIMASVFVEDAYDKQSILSEPDVVRRQRLLRVQLRSMLKPSS